MALLETRVEFTIDGHPVRMNADWSADMVAPGGFNRFSGSCDPAGLPWIGQGSILTAYRAPRKVLWQGALSQPPRLWKGYLRLDAAGPKASFEKAQGFFPEQIRDYGQWQQSGADGYSYPQDNSIQLSSQDGQLGWQVTDNTSIGASDMAGYLLWRPGWPFTRLAYTITTNVPGTANYEVRIYTAVGPSGSSTLQQTDNLAASPTNRDYSITTTDDMVMIFLRRIGGAGTTSGNFWVNLKLVRANYLAVGDSMTASDVLNDLGGYLGFDTTRVVPSAANVLPQDWQSGSWDQFAYQVASYEDYCVSFQEDLGLADAGNPSGFQMVAGPWGAGGPFKTWTVGGDYGANMGGLTQLEMFNEIVVPYTTASGAPSQYVLDADIAVDPLVNPMTGVRTVNTHFEDITSAGPQQDNTLPSSVASNLLNAYITPRLAGDIDIGALEGPDGIHEPYELQAGDLLILRDNIPPVPPQRVVTAAYGPGGKVKATVSRDISAAGLLASAAASLARST